MVKKQLQLSLPTPCTEDWNTMTPIQNGKFCAACQKNVIDFTRMSDAEIIQYFTHYKGETCGSLTDKQLNSIITEPSIAKPQNRWAWALSALLLPTIAASQTAKNNALTDVQPFPTHQTPPSVFEAKSVVGTDFLRIEGEVRELDGNFFPIDGAIVAITIDNKVVAYAQTDSLGIFSLTLPKSYENQAFIIAVTQIGFEKEELLFDNFATLKDNRLFISMKNTPIELESGVVIAAYSSIGKTTGVVAHVQILKFNLFQRLAYRVKTMFRKKHK